MRLDIIAPLPTPPLFTTCRKPAHHISNMVSTRNHPGNFPPPSLAGTPTKAITSSPTTPERAVAVVDKSPSKRATTPRSKKWVHTPSNLIILWILISVPLVVWDTSYILLRPHSMKGGKWEGTLWAPYEWYATVDWVYSQMAWDAKYGFSGAQSTMNIIEIACYLYYTYVLYYDSIPSKKPRAGTKLDVLGLINGSRILGGERAPKALVIVFSGAVMTFSKTLLYCKFSLPCATLTPSPYRVFWRLFPL
jgi:hypothetical protein